MPQYVFKLKVEVSSAVLLSLAVSLLSLGVSFLKEGNVEIGVLCIIIGFGVFMATIILLERGIISKLVVEKKPYEQTGENYS